jgi:lipopolysaccharide biosynthesis glycosyltransferase
MKDKKGIIYAVTGEQYLSEVYTSLKSIRNTNPDLPITVFSDIRPDKELLDDEQISHIDITGTKFPKRPKVACLKQTPYEKTLYLDSDTYVQGDLHEMFEFLDGFDIVCWQGGGNYESSHKIRENKEYPGTISSGDEFRERLNLTTPRLMPDYNSGVILYNLNDEVTELLANWESIYEEHLSLDIPGYFRDQPALRKAIFEADVKISGALPPECNCRVRHLYEARGLVQKIEHEPIIVHGGAHDIKKATKKLNERVKNKGYIIKPKNIFNEAFERGMLFVRSLQYNGIYPTFKKSKRYLLRHL